MKEILREKKEFKKTQEYSASANLPKTETHNTGSFKNIF